MPDDRKDNVIQPRVLKGFRDYLPPEMRARAAMIAKITEVFERFGFGPLETPALEYSDILVGKYGEDAEKLLYRFADHGGRDVCLRYDLTVPLARLVAQHKGLPKPFKRYQIAPVWRAEKPGRGRFREFVQCDADIVGSASLLHDAECIALGHAIMTALGIERFEIRMSTRKLLTALGKAVSCEDPERLGLVFRTIDKLPSRGEEAVRRLLESEAGCTPEEVERIMAFVEVEGDNTSRLERVRSRLEGTPGEEDASCATVDLGMILHYSRLLGVPDATVTIDPSIARGLDYYTGTVYETFLTDLPGFGSVMSGGRYDDLITRFLGKPVPAVGISVGIDRLFSGLQELGLVETEFVGVVAGLAALDDICAAKCLELLARVRSSGIASELLFDDERALSVKKQLRRASQRGVPYVLILGPDEVARGAVSLKDMRTGEQETLPVEKAIEKLSGPAKQ